METDTFWSRAMMMEEMTSKEFAEALLKTRTAILPLGSLEEHGTHLPLMTDTLHMNSLAKAAAREMDVLIAPALGYGLCRSTAQHPGTISIGFDTVRALVRDVGYGLYQQGIRNLIVASGHAGGGHMEAMRDAGEILLSTCPDLTLAVVSVVDLLQPRIQDLVVTPRDGHAGEIETAVMLHLAPDLVKGRSPKETPEFPPGLLVRHKTRYWPGGVNGDPGVASAEQGREIFRQGVKGLVALIQQIEAFHEV